MNILINYRCFPKFRNRAEWRSIKILNVGVGLNIGVGFNPRLCHTKD